MEKCHEWEIEVDQNKEHPNLDAQERFIVSFIGSLYRDIDIPDGSLGKVSSLHFTRIFSPGRDSMGAYVRLRTFAEENNLAQVRAEIDARLKESVNSAQVFQIKDTPLDWEKCCEEYGGSELAPVFRDYLESLGKMCYQLLLRKQEGMDVEKVLWLWTHFFFNMVRGYSCDVVEFTRGAVRQFIPNV